MFELLSRDASSSKLIMIFVQHLDSTGTVHIAQHTHTHKDGSAVTMSQANIDAVRESVATIPQKSYRHRSQELGLPPISTLSIMIKELKLSLT